MSLAFSRREINGYKVPFNTDFFQVLYVFKIQLLLKLSIFTNVKIINYAIFNES
jgi:hypothetical protein